MIWKTLWPVLSETGVWEKSETVVLAETQQKELNDYSLVGLLQYQELDILFTGDIGIGVEQELLEAGVLKEVELVKVPHHGSKTSSSPEFVKLVSPDWVVIGVGEITVLVIQLKK